jgi:hypothetical protein
MAMSYDQALNFYKKNRNNFPGMTASQAVDQIVRGGEIPVEAAPAAAPTAIPVAPPVAAALAAAAPAPAPEVEVVPEAAPAPVAAPPMNPYEMALYTYNQENPVVAAAPAAKGAPVDYAARVRQQIENSRRDELEANAKISRETKLDPEIQELISNRSKRYETELSQADKDRKQATWMAVAQAGMKMAQSQSPYFMQALASGMEAGIDGYSEAKAKAAEKKARLQDAKEDLVLRAKELRDQAVEKGINARLASKTAATADATLFKETLGGVLAGETAVDVVESAKLGNKLTSAQISKVYSDMATDKARLALQRATAGGGGPSFKTSDVKAVIAGAASDNRLIADRFANFTNPPSPAEKQQLIARRDQNDEAIRQGNSILSGKIGVSNNNPLGVSTPWRK